MTIKDWYFGEVRYCKDRRCGEQFIAFPGKRGQKQHYCSTAHQKREGQQVWRDKKKVAA